MVRSLLLCLGLCFFAVQAEAGETIERDVVIDRGNLGNVEISIAERSDRKYAAGMVIVQGDSYFVFHTPFPLTWEKLHFFYAFAVFSFISLYCVSNFHRLVLKLPRLSGY